MAVASHTYCKAVIFLPIALPIVYIALIICTLNLYLVCWGFFTESLIFNLVTLHQNVVLIVLELILHP